MNPEHEVYDDRDSKPVTRPDLRAQEEGISSNTAGRSHGGAGDSAGRSQGGAGDSTSGSAGGASSSTGGSPFKFSSSDGGSDGDTDSGSSGKAADSNSLRGAESSPWTTALSTATGATPAGRVKNFLWGSSRRRKATVGGGAGGVIVGGGILLLIISSGPAELVQLSHVLQRPFGNMQSTSSNRGNKLFRYAKYASSDDYDVGSTRLGFLANKFFSPQIDELAKLGITFDLSKGAGLNSATIDTDKLASKYPELKDMSTSDRVDWLNDHFPAAQGQFSPAGDCTSGCTSFTVDTGDFALSADKEIVSSSLSELDSGIVTSAINNRIFPEYLNVSSLFHPLSRAVENKLKSNATAAQREQEAETEEQTANSGVEDTPVAVSAEEDAKNASDSFGDPLNKALLVTGAACFIRSVSGDINTINRYEVVLPATVEGLRFVAIGEQIETGQDVGINQVGDEVASLTDSNGKDVFQGAALQALEGENKPSGTDLPDYERQAFTGSGTAKKLKSWADGFFGGSDLLAGAACSGPGQAIQILVGVGINATDIFDGGLSSAGLFALNQGESFVASALVMGLLHNVILNSATSGKLAKDAFSGGVGGDLLAYGAREAANMASIANGGVQLAGTAAQTLTYQEQQQDTQQFRSESFFARTFDINDYRSLLGRLAQSFSPSLPQDFATAVGGFSSLGSSLMSNLSSIFLPKSQADSISSYNWDLPVYGIPSSVLNNPSYANPYANADVVGKMLDADCTNSDGSVNTGCGEISKAQTCFGVNIAKDSSGMWNVTPQAPVDTTSDTYQGANCNDNSDSWNRIMLFVEDTRTMEAAACYAGDDQSCQDDGYTGSSGTSASSSTTTSSGTVPTGSAQQLAQQLLPYIQQGKITCNNQASNCPDIQNTATGTSIKGGQGCEVDALQPALLGMLLKLVQDGHTFVLSAICSDHHDDGLAGHAGGRAADFNYIDGVFMGPDDVAWSQQKVAAAEKLDQDIASFMPKSTGFGQIQCHPNTPFTFLNGFNTFNDVCNHQHVQVEN